MILKTEKQKLIMDFWSDEKTYDETLEQWEWGIINDSANFKDNHVSQLKKIDLSNLKIVHIGSLMLSHKEGREFFFEAVNYIRDNSKALISFDVKVGLKE